MNLYQEPPKLQGVPSELDAKHYKYLAERFGKHDNNFNEFVKDKKVIIVGPSPSLEGTGNGEFIDSFDLVVRINKGYPAEPTMTKDIGSRVDIHYHCFHEGDNTGGPILYDEMVKDNVYVCCPYPKYVMPFHIDVDRFEKTSQGRLRFHHIGTEFYMYLASLIKTRPNSGINTILDLLAYDIKELYVTGFTFFKDGWRKTYKDHIAIFGKEEGTKLEKQWLEGQFDGNHQQQPQMDIVRDLYLNDERFNIDDTMKEILGVK